MRCEQCTRFTSLEDAEELEMDLDVDADGMVSGTARFVRNCAECGGEMKEYNADVEIDLTHEFSDHYGEGHNLEIDDSSSSISSKTGNYVFKRPEGAAKDAPKARTFVPKYGRYAKTWYEIEATVSVKCECGHVEEGTYTEEFTASSMEELN